MFKEQSASVLKSSFVLRLEKKKRARFTLRNESTWLFPEGQVGFLDLCAWPRPGPPCWPPHVPHDGAGGPGWGPPGGACHLLARPPVRPGLSRQCPAWMVQLLPQPRPSEPGCDPVLAVCGARAPAWRHRRGRWEAVPSPAGPGESHRGAEGGRCGRGGDPVCWPGSVDVTARYR